MNTKNYGDEFVRDAIISFLRDTKKRNIDNKLKYDSIVENTENCFKKMHDQRAFSFFEEYKEKIWNEQD